MSLTPNLNLGSPEEQPMSEKESVVEGRDRRLRLYGILMAGALLIGGAGVVFGAILAVRLHRMEQELQARISKQEESLSRLRNRMGASEEDFADMQVALSSARNTLDKTQLDLRRARLAAEKLAGQQQESEQQLSGRLGQLAAVQDSTQGTLGSLSSDVNGVRGGLHTTRQDLAGAQSQLQRVADELGAQGGIVARNRQELAALRVYGERHYYEFDLRKTRIPQKFLGGVALQLKKTDIKRQKYTVDLIADDQRIEKKDKTANEPVQFYRMGQRVPTEIVVNQVYQDRVVGYISMPRQEAARLEIAVQSGGGS